LTGEFDEALGVRDVTWINANGSEMQDDEWTAEARCFGAVFDGRSRPSAAPQRGIDATLLMVLNGYHDLVDFTLPPAPEGRDWKLLIDTNLSKPEEADFAFGDVYQVTGNSLLLFLLNREKPAQ
jgi:glycogen operon protein